MANLKDKDKNMLTKAKEGIKKSINHLELEFSKLQLWRANPALVEWIMVDQYWSMQALKNVASVSCMDSQTLSIKPWDKTAIWPIAKAITDSGLWLNPQSMSDMIMIKIPALTEERRIELTKVAKKMAEEAKVWVRNARWDSVKIIKSAEDNKEISEDEKKDLELDLQKVVDESNKNIDEYLKKKQEDIMRV